MSQLIWHRVSGVLPVDDDISAPRYIYNRMPTRAPTGDRLTDKGRLGIAASRVEARLHVQRMMQSSNCDALPQPGLPAAAAA